jgi:D-3-phosphoglycerate dehydrogenase / 2-oxoglutarate reductase
MERILVTPRSLTASPHAAVERLRDEGFELVYCSPGTQPDEAELTRLVPGVVGWLAGVEPVSEAVIASADRLRAVSRNGVGTDNLPVPALARRGITLRTADGANAAGVTELTLGLIFAALRHIPAADAGIKAGAWPRRRGYEIRGRSVGVVGCGAVGRDVARLVAALGASVLAFDPLRPALDVAAERLRWADLPTLFAEADIVTLHCPPLGHGGPLIGAAELAFFKPGAILINTARAGLVDETAVMAALDDGRLATYATDVFAQEPPRSLLLAGHPGVIATSHIGGFTEESVERATRIAVANLLQALLKS